ncbi:MAG TPA: DUF4907 domain-containing protein [Bacteroidia bacterium]|jgi:hypothetical protein
MKKGLFFLALAFIMGSCSSPKREDKTEKKDPVDPNQEMEKKMKTDNKPAENPYKNAKIDVKVFNNDSLQQENNPHGYGYDVLMYDANYIHQPNIPAINGNRGFHTREQARTAAEFVVYKIRNNIMPPRVDVRELDSLGVLK